MELPEIINKPPTEAVLQYIRKKFPVTDDFVSTDLLSDILKSARLRSHDLDSIDKEGMRSLGPLDTMVTWPLSKGDVIWRSESENGLDVVRGFGIYVGKGYIVYTGPTIRSVSDRDGIVYWRQLLTDENMRMSLVKMDWFTKNSTIQCGCYNFKYVDGEYFDRMRTINLAISAIGVPIKCIVSNSTQNVNHFAVYARTGIWNVDSKKRIGSRSTVLPKSVTGSFSRITPSEKTLLKTPITFKKSNCEIDFTDTADRFDMIHQKTSYVQITGNGFKITYDTISIAEELIKQKANIQPYHDPLSGALFSEYQVATILAEATVKRDESDFL